MDSQKESLMENIGSYAIGIVILGLAGFGGISLLTGFSVNFVAPDLPMLIKTQIPPVQIPAESVKVDEEYVRKAESLGFTATTRHVEARKKWEIARGSYPILSITQIDSFSAKLKKATLLVTRTNNQWGDEITTWNTLSLDPIGKYDGFVPRTVMEDMEKAKAIGVFEDFQVMSIKKEKEIVSRDPVLLARVNGYPSDYFVVSVWLADARFDEIKKK